MKSCKSFAVIAGFVDELIDIAVKQQSSDLVFKSKPVFDDLIGIGKSKSTIDDEDEVPLQLSVQQNGDVDAKPPRIRKKKKKVVKSKERFPALSKKLLDKYPGSFYMAVRCDGCFFLSTMFSHRREILQCPYCLLILCFPGEKAGDPCRLTSQCSFWGKTDKFVSQFVYDDDGLPADYFG